MKKRVFSYLLFNLWGIAFIISGELVCLFIGVFVLFYLSKYDN